MKKKLFGAIFIAFTVLCNSQVKKENPIIYIESTIGVFTYNKGGGSVSISGYLNYQFKKNLLSFRKRFLSSTPFLNFEEPTKVYETDDFALLYGRRHIKNDFSYSYSGGISFIDTKEFNQLSKSFNNLSYKGLALELNFKWFNSERERIKILGIIPLTKRKSSFSFSNGVKIFGNISKRSFLGVSYTLGIGFHKKY